MITPALLELANDPEYCGPPLRVYVVLLQDLDNIEFRPVKASGLGLALRMQRQTVGRAIDQLVAAGYLTEGARTSTGIRTFRISYARRRQRAIEGLALSTNTIARASGA